MRPENTNLGLIRGLAVPRGTLRLDWSHPARECPVPRCGKVYAPGGCTHVRVRFSGGA